MFTYMYSGICVLDWWIYVWWLLWRVGAPWSQHKPLENNWSLLLYTST